MIHQDKMLGTIKSSVSWKCWKSGSQNPAKISFRQHFNYAIPTNLFFYFQNAIFQNQFTKHCLFLSFWVFCWLDLACALCHNLLPHVITNSLKKVFIFINKVPRKLFFEHIGRESKALFYFPCHDFRIYNFIANMQKRLQNCGRKVLQVFLMFLVENGKKSWKRVNHFYQGHNSWFFLIKDFHFSYQIGRNLQKNSNMDQFYAQYQ